MRNKRNHTRHLVGLILVLVALMSGVILMMGPTRLASAQTAIRATTNTNSAVLRANGKIAFTSDRDGNQEIYVMNSDGTNQVRLTNNPGVDDFPTWSPDGRTIAFVSQNAAGAFTINLMNADGTGQTTLTTIAFDNSPYPWHQPWSMSWSPDGVKIAFEESGEIFTINVDGSNRVNLTNHPAWDIEPSWSPDGSRIAFVSSRVFYLTIHTMNADGSNVRALPSAGELWDMSPDWSPTGDQIAFVVDSEFYLPILYTANADGTNRRAFDGNGTGSEHRNKPKWSPDGTKIVFQIWEYFSNDCEIYVKNVDGSGLTRLTNTTGRNYHPSWQPLVPASGPNTVQFSSASYSVSEGSPRVDITLTRSGDTTGAASVSFATNDGAGLQNCDLVNGMASPRCDYENTIGTVQFAAGETVKTLSVAIVDDSYAEGNETFTISLTGASGTTLDPQSSAAVMIMDNDNSNGADPIDDTNFFVRQQYIDFLGREPDPPGFNGWVNTINNCTGDTTQCDRIHVSQLFFQSEEFQSRGYFVYRFYPVAFGRKPDYGEFVPDLARVSGFLDANQLEAAKVQFIADFMARPAFGSAYNSLTNQQCVDALLNTAGVTLASRQSMIDGLNNSTMTRAQVLRQIVESSEVATKYNHQAYAVMEYFGYLRRQPDAFFLDWIRVLDQTNDPRGMVTGFVNSTEYRQRFGL